MPSFSTPPHRPVRNFWRDSFYYLDVSGLPVKANSAATVAQMEATSAAAVSRPGGNPLNLGTKVRVDPNNTQDWNNGTPVGYFVDSCPVPSTSRLTEWTPNSAPPHHDREHVWWSNLRQQGALRSPFGTYLVAGSGDRHAIAWCEDVGELMEAIGYNGAGPFSGHNVTYDLTSYDLPFGPNGTTKAGANATRIPIAPFFATNQDFLDAEAAYLAGTGDGTLGHMLCFSAYDYSPTLQWPARQGDGILPEPNQPVAGEVLRLPASFNADALPTLHQRVLARTLMKHGMQLFDKGDRPRIVLPNDPDWPNAFSNIGPWLDWGEFEVVDLSSVAGDPDSIRLSTVAPPPPNDPPVASFTFSPSSGEAPLSVDFDASSSSDPDGTIVNYLWNFGDGEQGSGETTSHTYTEAGSFSPSLTVTDNDGATDTAGGLGWVPAYPLDTPPGRTRFGAHLTSGAAGVPAKYETPIGLPLAIHRQFTSDWADRGNLVTRLNANTAAGRASWLSVKTEDWFLMASGSYDSEIDAVLIALRDTGTAVWLTPQHEPENDLDLGTPAEWRAMILRFEARRAAVGADNVLIVPILMDWTFNVMSGRNPDDWFVDHPNIPLYGVDIYTDDHETSPPGFDFPAWNNIVGKVQGEWGLDLAFGEFGGEIGSGEVRPPSLWAAMVAEAAALNLKAVCWFDNPILGIDPGANELGGALDPGGALYDAVLDTFAAPVNYREGLDWDEGAEPQSVVVTPSGDPTTFRFECGGPQTWTVPAGVTQISVDLAGASGGVEWAPGNPPALGGRVRGVLSVTPGEELQINVGCVGGAGIASPPTAGAGGFGGGGNGGVGAGGGGGATDIRRGPFGLGDRLAVAGGGGGNGANYGDSEEGPGSRGGGGGGGNGLDGVRPLFGEGGGGGTGGIGGAGGYFGGGGGVAAGGAGQSTGTGEIHRSGGGGGGGWGGGGGGAGAGVGASGGGGGGGGNRSDLLASPIVEQGVNAGAGYAEITLLSDTDCPYTQPTAVASATAIAPLTAQFNGGLSTAIAEQADIDAILTGDGQVAWWKMQDGAGGAVDSVGSLDAVAAGSEVYLVDGPVEAVKSIRLNAAFGAGAELVVPDDSILSPASAFTVEAWVYVDSLDGAGRAWVLSKRPNDASGNFEYHLLYGGGAWIFELGTGAASHLSASASTPSPVGQWTHVVGVYDGSSAKLYVNGALVATDSTPTGTRLGNTSGPLRLGSSLFFGGTQRLDGRLSHVALYASVLSDAEIEAHDLVMREGILTYEWDFGDGNTFTTTTPIVSHNYGVAGTYTATLTVSSWACSATTTVEVTVEEASTGTCPPVIYVGPAGGDSSSGGGGTETVAVTDTDTPGNLLVIVHSHGGSNGEAGPPVYNDPAGWTRVDQSHRSWFDASTWWFATVTVWAKIADGTEASVPITCTSSHIGRSRIRVYEFERNATNVADAIGPTVAYDGLRGAPIDSFTLDALPPVGASVLWAVTTAAPASGIQPNLTVDDAAGFDLIALLADTTYKSGFFVAENAPAGDLPLPVVTNTQADPFGDAWPWAALAVAILPGDPPIPSMTVTPNVGIAPLTVAFDASGSIPGSGTIVSYEWDFGDGDIGAGETTAHIYTTPGTYTVTLTVTTSTDCVTTVAETVTVSGAYLPIAGECDQVDSIFVLPGGFAETVDSGYEITWSAEPVVNGMRFTATIAVDPLAPVGWTGLWFFGFTASSDGGIGAGPPPSSLGDIPDFSALNVVIDASSGATFDIEEVVIPPGIGSWVSTTDDLPVPAGASLTVSFTIPSGEATYLALAIPGSDVEGTVEGGWPLSGEDGEWIEAIPMAWTADCPPPPTPVFASPVCIPGAQLGAGENTRVWLVDRGATRTIAELKPISGYFERRLNETSDLKLVGASSGLLGRACCDEWESLAPWATEVMVFRDGRDAWSGPVTDIRFGYGVVEVEAADLTAWWDRRTVPSMRVDDRCIGSIFEYLHKAAMEPDPIPNFEVMQCRGPIKTSRVYNGAEYRYVSDEIAELAETGLDWTAYSRTVVAGVGEIPLPPYVRLTDDFWSVPPTVRARGNEQATIVVVKGKGVSATATAPQEYLDYYGHLVRVFDEPDLGDVEQLFEQAQARLALLMDPLYIETPNGATLKPTAPITLAELIPGMRAKVDALSTCRPVSQDFRLTSVRAEFNGKVSIELEPLGTIDPRIGQN